MKFLILFIFIPLSCVSPQKENAQFLTPNFSNLCRECKRYFKNELGAQLIDCGLGQESIKENGSLSNCSFDEDLFVKYLPCLMGKKQEQIESILGKGYNSGENRIIYANYSKGNGSIFDFTLQYNSENRLVNCIDCSTLLFLKKNPNNYDSINIDCINCKKIYNQLRARKLPLNKSLLLEKYGGCLYAKSNVFLSNQLNLGDGYYMNKHQLFKEILIKDREKSKKIIFEFTPNFLKEIKIIEN